MFRVYTRGIMHDVHEHDVRAPLAWMGWRALVVTICLASASACGDGGAGASGFGPTTVATTAGLTGAGTTADAGSSAGAGSSGAAGSTGEPASGDSGAPTTGAGSTGSAASTGPGSESGGEASSGEAAEHVMFSDSLKGGTTGVAVGGSFGAEGWTVTDRADRVYWALPRLVEGSAEFTITGVTLANLPLNDHEIFAMYEGGKGIEHPINYNPEFRNNAFKSMIRIYGVAEGDRQGKQKIMWGMCPFGAGAHDGTCPCASGFFDEPFGGDPSWDGTPQVLRVEWADGVTRYLRNGAEVLTIEWAASGQTFGPEALYLSLGGPRPLDVDTAGMPIGAVFSDLIVEGWTGPESVMCR